MITSHDGIRVMHSFICNNPVLGCYEGSWAGFIVSLVRMQCNTNMREWPLEIAWGAVCGSHFLVFFTNLGLQIGLSS